MAYCDDAIAKKSLDLERRRGPSIFADCVQRRDEFKMQKKPSEVGLQLNVEDENLR